MFGATQKIAQSLPTPVFALTIEPAITGYWSRTAGATVVPLAWEVGTLNSTVWVPAEMQWPAVRNSPPLTSQPVQPIGMMRPISGWFDATRSSFGPHCARVCGASDGTAPWVSSGMNRPGSSPSRRRIDLGIAGSAPRAPPAGRPMTTSAIEAAAGAGWPGARSPGVRVTVNAEPLKTALSPADCSRALGEGLALAVGGGNRQGAARAEVEVGQAQLQPPGTLDGDRGFAGREGREHRAHGLGRLARPHDGAWRRRRLRGRA